ncbi:hypothetical protein WMF31_27360 [Sorangium sp. So ce1036]|uniref:hypothetical protein n=1 Tax=Sorangium sp. So ce1036 TaxID=3133328 RepID=UPI003EFE70E3
MRYARDPPPATLHRLPRDGAGAARPASRRAVGLAAAPEREGRWTGKRRGDGRSLDAHRHTPLDGGCEGRLNEATFMEIHLDKRAVKQIRLSAADAVEEGDTEALREDVLEAFSEEQVEEIERRLDSGDFFEFLTDVLDEWGGDDVDELFELLETQLGDIGIDLKYEPREDDDDLDEADEDDDDDLGDDDEDEDAELEPEDDEDD